MMAGSDPFGDQVQSKRDSNNSASTNEVKIRRISNEEEDPYPFEPVKLVLVVILFFSTGFMNSMAVGYVHGYAINYLNATEPLQDSVFNLIPQQDWAWTCSDIGTGATAIISVLTLCLHRHRTTVMRRALLVGSFLYVLRCITLFSTFLPPPFQNALHRCLPYIDIKKEPDKFFQRAIILLIKMGSSSDGHQFMCGDTIFSGHTMINVVTSWHVCNYAPYPLNPMIIFVVLPLAAFSLACIVVSRQHYTVDVVVAIFISVPVMHLFDFWVRTRRRIYVTGWRSIFYPLHNLFVFFEKSTQPAPMSGEISWPLPWPAVLVAYFQSLNRIPLRPVQSV